MFGPGPRTNVDPSDEYLDVMTRVGDRFPYCIPFGFSEGRNDIFEVRTRVYFCSECERRVQLTFAQNHK
jgi:hypothetical protein